MICLDRHGKFQIMGIVNVTPDSFSDGGLYYDTDKALDKALELAFEGANIIDVGAESTRPGALGTSAKEQWQRLGPLLKGLQQKKLRLPISVDTSHPQVMLKALDAGASILNSVQGVAPLKAMPEIAKHPNLRSYIAMHMHKKPKTMQSAPMTAQKAIQAIDKFFAKSHAFLREIGLTNEQIILDPGVGFGKSLAANLMIMLNAPIWSQKYQLLLGVSRKSWIDNALCITDPKERDAPSKITELFLGLSGVKFLRTHDVKTLARLQDTVTSQWYLTRQKESGQ